jgi:hypothetical protein
VYTLLGEEFIMNFRKILKYLQIVQTVSNKQRDKQGLKRLGRVKISNQTLTLKGI